MSSWGKVVGARVVCRNRYVYVAYNRRLKMPSEQHYESVLCDLLSLMQEAVLRLLASKPVDIAKFKHYCSSFLLKMAAAEEGFHQQKLRFTRHLDKLKRYCDSSPPPPRSTQPPPARTLSPTQTPHDVPQPPTLPDSKYRSHPKPRQQSLELRSIEEEEEEEPTRRRSGTAGVRGSSVSPGRPHTGQPHRERYKQPSSERQNGNFRIMADSQFTLDADQIRGRRKSFYDDLERQVGQAVDLTLKGYKLPARKQHHKYSQQIKCLL